jgi:RHS repeat-associated protein
MLVPNRHGSSNSYRYGFQGQEKDDELKGEGNSLNYTFRMHDPRVGRFFARDPLEKYYAEQTPYQFSSNAPIHARELEGKETSFDFRFERRERRLLAGEITEEQFRSENNAEGVGALIGGGVVLAAIAAPLIEGAYASYTAWFGTTSFSSYLSTGTGATLFAYLESVYTAKGLIQTNVGAGAISATANLGGQIAYNRGVIDENINWAQPLFAGIVKNPFWSNFGESILNVNYGYTDKFATEKTLNATGNYFDKNFFSTFGSNLIGSEIGKRFEVEGIGYKPVENVLNAFSATVVETAENKIGDVMKDIAKPKSENKPKKKELRSSIDGGNKSMSFPIK